MATTPALYGRRPFWGRASVDRGGSQDDARRSGRDWLVDWTVFVGAVALGGFTLGYLWGDHGPVLDGLDVVVGALACLALWARRSRPVETFVVAGVAGSFSPLALGAGLVVIFNTALRVRSRALIVCGVLMIAGSVAFPLANPKAGEIVKPAFPAFLLTVIAFASGLFVRAWRDLEESLRLRAEQLEADQERSVEAAREAERRRIAREMHDVVAHRLSLLSVHAGALEFRPGAPPEEIARAASVVRASAAAALAELRQVISLLREDDLAGSGPPQSSVAQLPDLLDESRNSGMTLRAHLDAGVADLPEALGRTAYRVVQEGLTNVRRHAPGSTVEVTVSANEKAALVVEVVNSSQADPEPKAGEEPVGGGAGLIGLGERLALAGGQLEHGPTKDGGYKLRAVVPRSP